MSSKRSKKKKSKQLEEKLKNEQQNEQTEAAEQQNEEDIPAPQNEETPEATEPQEEESDASQTSEVAQEQQEEESAASQTFEVAQEQQKNEETSDSNETKNVVDLQSSIETEDFNVMMQSFKAAVEHVNEKDPDEETLIRLFGECDSDSLKEKIIEHPFELAEQEEKRISHIVLKLLYAASAFLFVGVLFVFGIVSFLDTDKLVSETENRTLATKPHLTFTDLFGGKYTVEYENYYSDNFPARDFFIGINGEIKNLFTRFSAGENADVIISVDKSDDDFAGEGVDLGNKPETDDKKEPEYTPDEDATVKGSIILSNNRAMEIFTYNESNASRYASIVNKTAAAMPEGVKFYSLIAPTSVEFYGTKTYRQGVYSQKEAIKKVYSKLSDDVIRVDVYPALAEKSDEYIYFRTDHHWTARGAYYAYTAFCKSAGATPPQIEEFLTHKIEDFVGSLYRSSQAEELKSNPDYVECFELIVDASNMVYNDAGMTDGISTYIVAKTVGADNKYLAFISGDQPLEKITTSTTNGKKILVIKESFGNAFVPFLCNNYEEIYVVDPRKIDMYLPDFVEAHGIQEVVAINYCFAISNKKYCNELEKLTVKDVKE